MIEKLCHLDSLSFVNFFLMHLLFPVNKKYTGKDNT